ncbi:hypothetical protein SGLAM104S_06168 [Streptomyces glaucescens]
MLAFIADSRATSTTTFISWPAPGMPRWSRVATYGPDSTISFESHGTSVTTTAIEPM